MLAGLLFALHDAADRPDALTATSSFGGATLIEHQARVLIELGASHLIIMVSRLTPELLGAIARIGRRGVTVDAVRSAAEAMQKLHPLGRLLVLADGLVTAAETLVPLAAEGGDALLVTEAASAPAAFERIGGAAAWAGAARLCASRLADVARLPRDYDPQSALLRVAEQARAAHLLIGAGALSAGHGIEHRSAALAEHNRALLVASLSRAVPWFDRWLVAPLARAALPRLLDRVAPTALLAGAGAILGVTGLGAMALGHASAGLALLLFACLPLSMGVSLGRFREEPRLARGQDAAIAALSAAGALLLGRATGDRAGLVVALGLIIAGALTERAAAKRARRGWWASPPTLLLALAGFTISGWPLLGLCVATGYAVVTLDAAIDALRRQA